MSLFQGQHHSHAGPSTASGTFPSSQITNTYLTSSSDAKGKGKAQDQTCDTCLRQWPVALFPSYTSRHERCIRCSDPSQELFRLRQLNITMVNAAIAARQKHQLEKLGLPTNSPHLNSINVQNHNHTFANFPRPYQLQPRSAPNEASSSKQQPPSNRRLEAKSKSPPKDKSPQKEREGHLQLLTEYQLASLANKMSGLRKVPEPYRATMWIQIHYRPGPPTSQIPQTAIWNAYRLFLSDSTPSDPPTSTAGEVVRLPEQIWPGIVSLVGPPHYHIQGLEPRFYREQRQEETQQQQQQSATARLAPGVSWPPRNAAPMILENGSTTRIIPGWERDGNINGPGDTLRMDTGTNRSGLASDAPNPVLVRDYAHPQQNQQISAFPSGFFPSHSNSSTLARPSNPIIHPAPIFTGFPIPNTARTFGIGMSTVQTNSSAGEISVSRRTSRNPASPTPAPLLEAVLGKRSRGSGDTDTPPTATTATGLSNGLSASRPSRDDVEDEDDADDWAALRSKRPRLSENLTPILAKSKMIHKDLQVTPKSTSTSKTSSRRSTIVADEEGRAVREAAWLARPADMIPVQDVYGHGPPGVHMPKDEVYPSTSRNVIEGDGVSSNGAQSNTRSASGWNVSGKDSEEKEGGNDDTEVQIGQRGVDIWAQGDRVGENDDDHVPEEEEIDELDESEPEPEPEPVPEPEPEPEVGIGAVALEDIGEGEGSEDEVGDLI